MKHSAGTGSKKNTYHRLVATNPSAHNTLNWHKEDQNSLACSKKSMKNKFNESNTHHNSELQNYLKCEWQLLKVQILTCIAWHRKRHKKGLQQISSNSKLTVRANFFILYPDLYVNSMKFHLLRIQKKIKMFSITWRRPSVCWMIQYAAELPPLPRGNLGMQQLLPPHLKE